MRWDRLFEDLEAASSDLARDEADALADDLRDEEWADTSWRDLLGGRVRLEVRGAGQVTGEVASVNETLVRLRAGGVDQLVGVGAVVRVLEHERRADAPSRLDAALGWATALRRLRDDGEPVRVVTDDGASLDGRVDVVGKDFVRIAVGSGRGRVVVLARVAVVQTLG